jgi:uncharacterized protein (DUF302 family)
MLNYGFERTVRLNVADAENRITHELKKEGFGLVTRINMKQKFKDKLNIDYNEYIILGFCNPSMAHDAVEAEDNIGLLLPCNVVVYEKEGRTNVTVIKPTLAMSMVENQKLIPMALKIEKKLEAAAARL